MIVLGLASRSRCLNKLLVLCLDEVEHLRLVILLRQVNEERRSVVFILNNLDRLLLVSSNDSVEEWHWRADRCHLVFIFVTAVIPRIRSTSGVPKGVDEGVEGHPD